MERSGSESSFYSDGENDKPKVIKPSIDPAVIKHRALVAEGDSLLGRGDYKRALKAYSGALEIRDNDVGVLVSRSKCHTNLGNPDSALLDADAALKEDSEFYKALYVKAEALYAMGDFEFALVFYHRGRARRPELGMFQRGIHKSREAIDNSIGAAANESLMANGNRTARGGRSSRPTTATSMTEALASSGALKPSGGILAESPVPGEPLPKGAGGLALPRGPGTNMVKTRLLATRKEFQEAAGPEAASSSSRRRSGMGQSSRKKRAAPPSRLLATQGGNNPAVARINARQKRVLGPIHDDYMYLQQLAHDDKLHTELPGSTIYQAYKVKSNPLNNSGGSNKRGSKNNSSNDLGSPKEPSGGRYSRNSSGRRSRAVSSRAGTSFSMHNNRATPSPPPVGSLQGIIHEGIDYLEGRAAFWEQQAPHGSAGNITTSSNSGATTRRVRVGADRDVDLPPARAGSRPSMQGERPEQITLREPAFAHRRLEGEDEEDVMRGPEASKFALESLDNINNALEYGDPELGLRFAENFLRRLSRIEVADKPKIEGNVHCSMGNTFIELRNFESAVHHHQADLAIARSNGYEDARKRALGNVGRAFALSGDYTEAIEHWLRKKDLVSDSQVDVDELEVLIAQAYLDSGIPDQCISHALGIANHARHGGSLRLQNRRVALNHLHATHVLAQAYEQKAYRAKAKELYELFVEVATSIGDDASQQHGLMKLKAI